MPVTVTTIRVSTPPFFVVSVYWFVGWCIIFGWPYIGTYSIMTTLVDVETRIDTQ